MTRILLLVGLFGAAGPAHAQFGFLEGRFRSVNSVSISMQGGWLDDETRLRSTGEAVDLFGLGTEVYINLPAPEGAFLEMALGTTYLRGFASKEPTFDLRGSLRTLPTPSLYVTHLPGSWKLEPYAGVNLGTLTLDAAQAGRRGTTYTLLLQLQDQVLNDAGRAVTIRHPRLDEQTGAVASRGGRPGLAPDHHDHRHTMERTGDALMVRLADTNHLLRFRKRN